MRRLRGGRLDIFGMTAERRTERELIGEFEDTVEQILQGLSRDRLGLATDVVKLYLDIRGYGPVKDLAVAEVRAKVRQQLGDFLNIKEQAA